MFQQPHTPEKSHTIQNYFTPVPTPSKSHRFRDGFDGENDKVAEDPRPPAIPWAPKSGVVYTPIKIGAIKSGPGRITFTGRVANFRDVEKNSKQATAARVLLRMTLMDETGVIDVADLAPYLPYCTGQLNQGYSRSSSGLPVQWRSGKS